MFCKNCGAQFPDNMPNCPNCGAVVVPEQQPQYPPQYGQPQYGQPQYPPQYGQPQYPPQYGQPQYPPQPQYAQPQYGYPQQPAEMPGKGMAIASLSLGILSFFCFGYISGILGIIFGAIAKNKGYKGGMATAGIICGAVGFALTLILQIVGVSLLAAFGYY